MDPKVGLAREAYYLKGDSVAWQPLRLGLLSLAVCASGANATAITISGSKDFAIKSTVLGAGIVVPGINLPGKFLVDPRLGPLISSSASVAENQSDTGNLFTIKANAGGYSVRVDYTTDYNLSELGLGHLSTSHFMSSICTSTTCAAVPPTFRAVNFGSRLVSASISNPPGNGASLIPVRINGAYTTKQNGEFLSSGVDMTGRVNLSLTYESRSTKEYIQLLTSQATGTNVQRALTGYSDAVNLRNTSFETGQQNENLRNAEYWLRGYYGGAAWRATPVETSDFNQFWNDVANRWGPIATATYNGIKWFRNQASSIPFVGDFITPIGGTGSGPASAPGGFRCNASAWLNGLNQVPLDNAISNVGDDNCSSTTPPPSTNPQLPMGPLGSMQSPSSEFDIFYANSLVANETYYFDPKIANAISYGVEGNRFRAFEMPSDLGYSGLTIHFLDQVLPVASGSIIDFSAYDPMGIDGFILTGFPEYDTNGPDFVAGLRFMKDGEAILGVTALNFSNVVPEPASIALLCGGFIGLGWSMRKRAFR